jgi:poly-gamma-glutamate system protein
MKPATTQAGAAMTHVYWRPQRVGARALMLVTALAVVALAAVEFIPTRVEQRHYEDKLKAARLAQKAFGVLKTERQRLGIPIDAETDPGESGLVGALMSPVTTNSGHLPAKQTTLNPNWAAVFVGILKAAGLNAGDTVAIGVSGSFPAWNVATFAAVETLKLKPIVIASVSGSQFGANDPRFLWPDMEKLLFDRRVFTFRSVAASRGGLEDRALGLPKDSRALLDEAISRNGLAPIIEKTYAESLDRRIALYREAAAGAEIRAYINVGGGTVSVGTRAGKGLFGPGLNRTAPRGATQIDSVMTRFALEGVPVVHLIETAQLARKYGLPLAPRQMPKVGEGAIFTRLEYNRWLAAAMLLLVLGVLVSLVRTDIGRRLFGGAPPTGV